MALFYFFCCLIVIGIPGLIYALVELHKMNKANNKPNGAEA